MARINIGSWYPVDGESFANGKRRDIEVVLYKEDIVGPMCEFIVDSGEIDPKEEFQVELRGYVFDFKIGDFIDENEISKLREKIESELTDDDFGTKKHEDLICNFINSKIDGDFKEEISISEFR